MPLRHTESLASAGTTGNNTHGPKTLPEWGGDRKVALVFTISTTGSTPTVTFKLQGSMDATNFADITLLPTETSATAASVTKTGLGTYIYFIDQQHTRRYESLQLVTSSNTNVTYNAQLVVLE